MSAAQPLIFWLIRSQHKSGAKTQMADFSHFTQDGRPQMVNAWEKGWVKPIDVKFEKEQSVGIIGAGPAGLAAAEQLRKNGYKITVYDRYDRAGGLLIYGIPNFKLEKHVVQRRTKLLKDGGIEFVQNFEVGKDATLDQLRKKHDAILIATGVYKPRERSGRAHV